MMQVVQSKKVQLAGKSSRASSTVWMPFDDDKVGAKSHTSSKYMYKAGINVNWTPIQPVSRQFQVGRSHNTQVIRKQFPLRHSGAKTIYRCQGNTLNEVVVDFTTVRKEAHIHYVGLSCVRTLQGLHI